MALDLLVFGANIVARHTTFPAGGLVESGEHVHGSGLACAVGPEETEDFAPFHTERDVVDGAEIAEGFDEMFHFDDRFVRGVVGRRVGQCGRIEDVAKFREDVVGCTDASDAPLREEGHAVASAHFVQVGSGGNDGDLALHQAVEYVPKLLATHRIDAGCGFVKEENARPVDECAAQGQLLFHAAREGAGFSRLEALDLCVDGANRVVVFFYGSAEKCGEKFQVFFDGEVFVERKLPGHVAHTPTYFLHLSHHIEAIHRGFSFAGEQQGAENAEQGGFACAVRADESEQLTFFHRKTDLVQRLHGAVTVR